jgi:hypothetical protein
MISTRVARIVLTMERGGFCWCPPSRSGARKRRFAWRASSTPAASRVDVYVDSPMVDATRSIALSRDLNFDWSKTRPAGDVAHASSRRRGLRSCTRCRPGDHQRQRHGDRRKGSHHLRRRLPDARNTVLFAGYQVDGTRGASSSTARRHQDIR